MMIPLFSSYSQSLSQSLPYVVILVLFTVQASLVFAHPGQGRRDIHARHQAVPEKDVNTVDDSSICRNVEAS